MQQLKIDKIGNSLVVILSPEIADKLQINEGDYITAIDTANGIKILSNDSFNLGMFAYEKVAARYANALEELAK